MGFIYIHGQMHEFEFGEVYRVLAVAVIPTSVGWLVPFFLFYHDGNASLVGEFGDDCDQFGRRTQTCVDDLRRRVLLHRHE